VTRAPTAQREPAAAGARVDGYAAIEDYAAIGDGRTVALVARDGSIDWLPVPKLSDAPVFSALLDADVGGRFVLAPVADHEVERAYARDTNVLRTTFTTAAGRATVTDALTTQDGGVPRGCAELDLAGYRGSRPVFTGNAATGQAQLGNYGDLLETIHYYVRYGNSLNRETAIRVAEVADFVCRIWENEDAGIWELHEPRHYTISKIGSYTFYAGSEELDAAVLLAARNRFCDDRLDRLDSTLEAVRRELGDGPLVYRYSGQEREEGAFLACSFWLADALLRCGRRGEARALMDELVGLANDVGLYAEELGPDGHMLGNFPQALTHLSLINTAASFAEAEQKGEG
jgi:GH15 family glucan-1,4-alpha-glucosidase